MESDSSSPSASEILFSDSSDEDGAGESRPRLRRGQQPYTASSLKPRRGRTTPVDRAPGAAAGVAAADEIQKSKINLIKKVELFFRSNLAV